MSIPVLRTQAMRPDRLSMQQWTRQLRRARFPHWRPPMMRLLEGVSVRLRNLPDFDGRVEGTVRFVRLVKSLRLGASLWAIFSPS